MRLPLVRVGVRSRAVVSVGRGQRELAGEGARRRRTGGAAVLAGPWAIEALVALPRAHPALARGPREAAGWFGGVHRDWLRALGVPATCWDGAERIHWACIAGRSRGEVLAGGGKVTGLAQHWGVRRVVLGSITLARPAPWLLLAGLPGREPDDFQVLEAVAAPVCDFTAAADVPAWAGGLRARLHEAVHTWAKERIHEERHADQV